MRALLCVALAAAWAAAGEPKPDPATTALPAETTVAIRFASLDRLDAIAADWQKMADDPRRPLFQTWIQDREADRTRPVYFTIGRGSRWHYFRKDGTFTSDLPFRNRRAKPLSFLDGDAAVVVPVAEQVQRNRKAIETGLARTQEAEGMAPGMGVPSSLARGLGRFARGCVGLLFDIDDIQYALTWREGRLESEGWIRCAGSPLQRFLRGAGPRGANPLVAYLPRDSLVVIESCGTASWLDREAVAFLDGELGAGAGRKLLLGASPSFALADLLTGRAAAAIQMTSPVTGSMLAIWEIRPEADIAAAIRKFDAGAVNALYRKLELPLELRFEHDFHKIDDTAVHRISLRSRDARIAPFLVTTETCFAVEGRHLLIAQSTTARGDIERFVHRVRRGAAAGHPHLAAAARLQKERHEAVSVNLGALRPLARLAVIALPSLAEAALALPEELYVTTTLSVIDGDIYLRGDWPVREILTFVRKLRR